MKSCSKCKEVKPLSEFHKSGNGFKSRCKSCIKEDSHNRYTNNKEHIGKVNKYYVINNRDKVNSIAREYYKNNREKCLSRTLKWQAKNKEYIRLSARERAYTRKKLDPVYKLSCKIRSDVHKILSRKTHSTNKYLGCNYSELLSWLNSNVYGFSYGDSEIDIDHIVPLSSANSEEELLQLLNYKNLQLLPSHYNRNIKRDKNFDKKDFEEWLKKRK